MATQEIKVYEFIYLQAPNGHIYKITIDNSGELNAQDVGNLPVN